MKITIESIALPTFSAVIGKKTDLDFDGGTVADLVNYLIGCLGAKARKELLDRTGQLDLTIQVMVNEEGFLAREELPKRRLMDGDRILFMPIVSGG
jgi:molybdopterin converting factor small subunit